MVGRRTIATEQHFYLCLFKLLFACLGSGVDSGGCSCPGVRRRLGVAGSIVARLGGVWRRRGLGLSAGLGVCTSLVRSVVLCGSEAWTVRRVDSGGVRSGLFDVEDATTLSCSSAAVTVSE